MDGKLTKIVDCKTISLPTIYRNEGQLTVIEIQKQVFFDIKRVYYIYGVGPYDSRGHHAHKTLFQLIVPVIGGFGITLKDGVEERTFWLNSPKEGLLVVPGIWRELHSFEKNTVCLVLASEIYYEEDYIRKYKDFLSFKDDNSNNSKL